MGKIVVNLNLFILEYFDCLDKPLEDLLQYLFIVNVKVYEALNFLPKGFFAFCEVVFLFKCDYEFSFLRY